jgi:predicted AlkP superfamily pyrophosphatase or phosphodiesterase
MGICKMSKTIIIMLDAFINKYITKENTPFIFSLKKKFGTGILNYSFGFKGTTGFYTGLQPKNFGLFTNYGFDGKVKKFPLSIFLKSFPGKFKFYIINLVNYFFGNCMLYPDINIKYFKYFKMKQKKNFFQKNSVSAKTLFDIFKKSKINYLFYSFPFIVKNNHIRLHKALRNNDEVRVKKFLKLVCKKNYDFYYIHLLDLDPLGHKYGPNSGAIKKFLEKTDNYVKEILSNFDLKKDNVILWSDHGMVEIKQSIDLQSKLPPFGKGYIYFLESAMARFWFFDHDVEKKVLSVLKNQKSGRLLSEKEKKSLGINFESNFYGDEIFLADSGTLIFPNFFNSPVVKGMHGFDLSDPLEKAFFIVNKPSRGVGNMEDLFSTILEMMNLNIPNNIKGKSLLR